MATSCEAVGFRSRFLSGAGQRWKEELFRLEPFFEHDADVDVKIMEL